MNTSLRFPDAERTAEEKTEEKNPRPIGRRPDRARYKYNEPVIEPRSRNNSSPFSTTTTTIDKLKRFSLVKLRTYAKNDEGWAGRGDENKQKIT